MKLEKKKNLEMNISSFLKFLKSWSEDRYADDKISRMYTGIDDLKDYIRSVGSE